jgi:hypothetical protein
MRSLLIGWKSSGHRHNEYSHRRVCLLALLDAYRDCERLNSRAWDWWALFFKYISFLNYSECYLVWDTSKVESEKTKSKPHPASPEFEGGDIKSEFI